MSDPLRSAARRAPGSPALLSSEGLWSYGRLDEEADRLGAGLAAAGLPPGGRVAVRLPRGPLGVAAVHAAGRAGGIYCPLHAKWTPAETERHLRLLRPAVLLTEGASPERPEIRRLEGATEGPESAAVTRRIAARTGRPETGRGGDSPSGEPDHAILATSGTGGSARGVRLSLRALVASAEGSRERLRLSAEDRWYAALSLAHVGGLAMAVRAAVLGCSLVVDGEFDAGVLSGRIDRGEVTHASLVPVMLRRLLTERGGRPFPSSLRCLLLGGAATPSDLLERALQAGAPVALTYGLSEAASQVATASPELVRRQPGTVGPPLPGTELRIGADGEILVRGPTLMNGYLGDAPDPIVDGWLRTGDAGRLDGEGHLWVTGRLSARIVTGGVTVDPSEVEAVLAGHPEVRECLVVGVPDPEWGERVVAFVSPSRPPPGQGSGGPNEAAEGRGSRAEAELRGRLEAHCRERLSSPRRPRQLVLVEELPRNPNGKPDVEALRRRLL